MTKVVLLWITEFYFISRNIPGPDHGTVLPSITMSIISKKLEEEKIENKVIDTDILYLTKYKGLSSKEFGKKIFIEIEKLKPEIIGVGSWVSSVSFEFLKILKERNPNVKIILGGINATFLPSETLKLAPWIDIVVRGEGQETFVELIKTLTKNRNLSVIKGISFKRNKEIFHTIDRIPKKTLDEYPIIDFENFIGIEKYRYFDRLTYF
jgi:uncharacterized protein YuzE|tara:strand:+ start:231 stop:857 length:627 start_codon:yes stop_codon:yes gene_type:complete